MKHSTTKHNNKQNKKRATQQRDTRNIDKQKIAYALRGGRDFY